MTDNSASNAPLSPDLVTQPGRDGSGEDLSTPALEQLIELAGPDRARDLLRLLCADLQAVNRGLEQTGIDHDWAELRSHSHVLMSLAGAMGDMELHARARALNIAAHHHSPLAITRMLPEVQHGVRRLTRIAQGRARALEAGGTLLC
jgi:HPt (histidine-containing phosphotransfer) domain-containing protein